MMYFLSDFEHEGAPARAVWRSSLMGLQTESAESINTIPRPGTSEFGLRRRWD